jgi:hypothetical protein
VFVVGHLGEGAGKDFGVTRSLSSIYASRSFSLRFSAGTPCRAQMRHSQPHGQMYIFRSQRGHFMAW